MKIQIIPVEPYDNLYSIKEKVLLAKAQRVILNDLDLSPLFQDIKISILLNRYINKLGKTGSVVTKNDKAIPILQNAGFVVEQDLLTAQRSVGENITYQEKYLSCKKNTRLFIKADQNSKVEPGWLRYSAFIIGIITLVSLLILFLPKATIIIDPPESTQEVQLPVNLPGFDRLSPSFNSLVGARYMDTDVICSIQTYGKKVLPISTAKGEVTFTNLSLETIEIPEGLILLSSDDSSKEYITTKSGQLDPETTDSLLLLVMAKLPGSQGNAESQEISTIVGQLGLKISVINMEPVDGGIDEEKAYPSDADIDRLRDLCASRLLDEGQKNAEAYFDGSSIFLPETIRIHRLNDEIFFPGVDKPTETLNLSQNAEVSILYIDKTELENYSKPYLDALLQPGYSPSGTIEISSVEVVDSKSDDNIKLLITVTRSSTVFIDSGKIKSMAAGKGVGELIELIINSYPKGTRVQISRKPEWLPIMPLSPLRIQVNIGNQE